MATLDDKILGEKLHYYCSSSDEDGNDSSPESEISESEASAAKVEPSSSSYDNTNQEYQSRRYNTGPKGVVEDWRRAKQLENEAGECEKQKRNLLLQKLNDTSNVDREIDTLLVEDDWERCYLAEKLEQQLILNANKSTIDTTRKSYGTLIHLKSSSEFVECSESDKNVTTLICIYTEQVESLMSSLSEIAASFPKNMKICAIPFHTLSAYLSRTFKKKGCPALLVYRGGVLVNNVMCLHDKLQMSTEDRFVSSDLESLLLEERILCDEWVEEREQR